MPQIEDPRDTASAWVARTRDPDFADWRAFTRWLETDPANNTAYEAALQAHDAAAALNPRIGEIVRSFANDDHITAHPRFKRRWVIWGTGAVAAASIAAAVSLSVTQSAQYVVTTNPGQPRSIILSDGSQIAINGGSRLVLDRYAPRSAKLEYGEANFSIVHDMTKPFTVEVGDTQVQDLGTRFNVIRSNGSTEVAVAEGTVLFDPGGASVKLTPGRVIRSPDNSQMLELADMDPATIGSWRTGRLFYRNAPITQVAADLARAVGEPITISPATAAGRFSGSIIVRGVERQNLFAKVAMLLDVSVKHDASGWHLSKKARATG